MDLSSYAGRWVALVSEQVAGVGHTPEEARHLAQRNRSKDRFVLHYVDSLRGDRLMLSPLMERLRPFLSYQSQPVYLVGGAVRDALLGRPSHDLDFVVPQRAIKLAFHVADQLGVPAYVLDRARDTGRIVLQDERTTLDFACFRGDDLEADLRERDFTINAMAVPATAVSTSALIDPCSGQTDLQNGRIHPTHPDAVQQDPVRTLRAVRLAADLGFSLSTETETAVQAAIPHLARVSNERIRDELLKLLQTAVPAAAVAQMDALGLLTAVLPEIAALRNVTQTDPHHEPVLAHTLHVLEWLTQIETGLFSQEPVVTPALNEIKTTLADWLPALQTHLARAVDGGLDGLTLLRLGALGHDVGKKETQTVAENGRIRFLGHDKVGAGITAGRLRTLCVSNQAIRHVQKIVRHHMRLFSLLDAQKRLSRRAIYRFFRDTGAAGLDVCLLALADYLAINQGEGETAVWQRLLSFVAELFQHYFEQHEEVVAPLPLVNGRDLMQLLQLQPGPEIGRLLRLIEEAQAVGDIQNREQALHFARQCHQ